MAEDAGYGGPSLLHQPPSPAQVSQCTVLYCYSRNVGEFMSLPFDTSGLHSGLLAKWQRKKGWSGIRKKMNGWSEIKGREEGLSEIRGSKDLCS